MKTALRMVRRVAQTRRRWWMRALARCAARDQPPPRGDTGALRLRLCPVTLCQRQSQKRRLQIVWLIRQPGADSPGAALGRRAGRQREGRAARKDRRSRRACSLPLQFSM